MNAESQPASPLPCWLYPGIAMLLGAIFLYAGIPKMVDPHSFAASLSTFGLLPQTGITLVALTLPPFEILLGLCLILGFLRHQAALGVFLLCVVFAGAIIQGMLRGLSLDCGCFGAEVSASAPVTLARDLLLMLLAGTLLGMRRPLKHRR